MKFATILAATVAFAATAHAAECDTKLIDALSIPELETCETDSGFDFVELATPTDQVLTKFCKSEACMTIWKTAKGLGLEECAIRGKQLYKDVLDPLEAACKKVSASTNNATEGDSHDHAHGSHSSHDVAGAHDSHDDSHGSHDSHDHGSGKGNKKHSHGSGSMEDSSDNDSMVKAPSNSSMKPTIAPNSAASSLSAPAAAVVGAAVLSIAASFS